MSKIIFINDPWLWPLLTVGLILLTVFILKELALQARRRSGLKILLSIIAIIALELIALKPAVSIKESGGKIALLTPGYNKTQLNNLKKESSRLKVLNYDPKGLFPEDIHTAEIVYILGHGIREYDFEKLENIPAIHIPGESPEGIVKIKFSDKFTVGDDFKIGGLYRNSRPGNLLVLQGPGGISLDSVILQGGNDEPFQLASELKAAGTYVFSLVEKNPNGEALTVDPVPVKVEDKKDLRILILNNFPTFETKYLKNFLAEAGHELVVRSLLTRGRFKYEYFNTDRTVIGSLSRETLKPYDLLILDAVSLRGLGGSQVKALEEAVRQDGLGVFIQPDVAFFNSPGSLIDLNFQKHIYNEISLEGWSNIPISKFPFSIVSTPGMERINVSGNVILTGYNKIAKGRIGTSVFSNTWELVLEGNSEVYRNLWSGMIQEVSKRDNESVQFQQEEMFVSPHEPFHFKIRSDNKDLEITNSNGRIIPVVQDKIFSNQWTGTLWPREPGWHQLQNDTSAVFNYFVSQEGNWSSLMAQNTLVANNSYFVKPFTGKGNREWPLEPINPLWFYGIFIICMGGLWLEPKLS